MDPPITSIGNIPQHVFPEKNHHFIGNEYVPSKSGGTYELVNPITGKSWQEVAKGSEEEINAAVEAAESALDEWQALGYMGRQKILLKLADEWEANYKDLALLESATNGTPLSVQEFVIQNLANDIRYHAGWTDKCEGRVVNVDGPFHVYTRREPLGVCGIIGPWNLPLWCIMVNAAPALAAGNTLVIKPSEQTPLTMLKVAEMARKVGFPAGVVNVVCGFGDAGAAITSHMKIKKVAFTGSTEVGRLVMEAAAKSNLKQVHLELGGKSPIVVFEDADIDEAVQIANFAVMNNNGQICTAGSRTFVHTDIYDKFVKKAGEVAVGMKVGNPLLPNVQIGPLVDSTQYSKVISYIDIAKSEGCQLVAGGNKLQNLGQGFYMEPTVFAVDTNVNATIAKEEIFGPVQTIIRFKDVSDVIKQMNDSPYGLAAAVISKDIGKVFAIANKVQAGTVWVNNYHNTFHNAPFGGYKSSGYGREGGKEGYEQWTQVKTVVINVPSLM